MRMERWLGWFRMGRVSGKAVIHLWGVSVKDPGNEVTSCGKRGHRGRPEAELKSDAPALYRAPQRCARCEERAIRRGIAA